jgi:lipopolysaccharide/colanic/teichoic acid biosynthesis glycosyltransferase
MNRYHRSITKRALDLIFSLLVLPVALPLMVLCAFLVLVSSGSPVFFCQERVGRNGEIFRLIKIRTLKKSFSSAPGAQHTIHDITALGRFLRKSRLDEIPQIWNILVGEMSWVGPRPEVPYYYEHYKKLEPTYASRQLVRPGITGMAQLDNPDASPNENLEKLTFDLEYVHKGSFGLDVHILLKSFLFVWK